MANHRPLELQNFKGSRDHRLQGSWNVALCLTDKKAESLGNWGCRAPGDSSIPQLVTDTFAVPLVPFQTDDGNSKPGSFYSPCKLLALIQQPPENQENYKIAKMWLPPIWKAHSISLNYHAIFKYITTEGLNIIYLLCFSSMEQARFIFDSPPPSQTLVPFANG